MQEIGVSRKSFLCRGSRQGQNARNWRPRIIPRKGLPFRGPEPVPSKGWLFDAGRERHSGDAIRIEAIKNCQRQNHDDEGERTGLRARAAAGQPSRTVERSIKELSGKGDSAVGRGEQEVLRKNESGMCSK